MNPIHAYFFKTPNKIFDLDLTLRESMVLIYLISMINFDTTHPSLETIARKTKVSIREVSRAIKGLTKKGYLRYEKGGIWDGKKLCNRYTVLLGKIDSKCLDLTSNYITNMTRKEMDFSEMFRESMELYGSSNSS
jgi:DNA-binding transcriptional regulator YhcF (GntR family)